MEDATHMRVSLAAEPPAIFRTRRFRSSFLSSESCFDKSFLDLAYSIVSADIRKGWVQDALGLELVRLDLAGHFVVWRSRGGVTKSARISSAFRCH